MTDQERGLQGWKKSFRFDHGCVMFAYGGQNDTAFLSLPGEGCSFISDWQSFSTFLRDELQSKITRWDGAVDDFKGLHSVDQAVELYKSGGFKQGGRNPNPKQHGNWITHDDLGRTFEVGRRKNGKLIRIYEKGKQLGDSSSPWVRWEVELHAKDRVIPWDVLLHPGEYVAGAYPCMSWVSERAFRIHTIKEQDRISYERLKQVASTSYGALFNVMLQREGSAERVVALLKKQAIYRNALHSQTIIYVLRVILQMNFETDDLDWAMGELANLFAESSRVGILPHQLNPGLFSEAWTVLCFQPLEISTRCRQTLISMLTAPLWQVSKEGYIKRNFGFNASNKPTRYENTFTH